MRQNFDEALKAVLVHEGGYVNHPRDPGGATNKGITHRTYAAWLRKQSLPADKSVRHITDDEVAAIYRQQYWDTVRGDDLPSGVDYAVFDFAVNSGPSRAVKFLQRIVGTSADGVMGVQTLSAVDRIGAKELIRRLCDNRLAWLKKLKHWPTFGRGWSRRVAEVKGKSIRLAEPDYTHITGEEATNPVPGKADGPITTTAAIKEALKDPKAVGGAVVTAAPGVAQVVNGDGPVQYAIGAALVIAALAVAFMLWRNGREEA